VLGPIRVLLVEPRVGTRTAELLEMPIMFLVILIASRWIVRWLSIPSTTFSRLGMGLIALVLLLAAEFTFVLKMRRLTLSAYLKSRDPVSGTAYYAMLCVFAIMPLLLM